MDLKKIISKVFGWHEVFPDGASSCLGVLQGRFGKLIAVFYEDVHNTITVVRYNANGTSKRNIITVADSHGPFVLSSVTRLRIAVDERNNLYIVYLRSGTLCVSFVSERSSCTNWSRQYISAGGMWLSFSVFADDRLYLAAVITGDVKLREKLYGNGSILFALSHEAEVVWDARVPDIAVSITSVPGDNARLYVNGTTRDSEVAINCYTREGMPAGNYYSQGLCVIDVTTSVLLTDTYTVAVAGTVAVEGVPHLYHLTFNTLTNPPEITRVMTTPAVDGIFSLELESIGTRALLLVQIEDIGSFIFDGVSSKHAFTDQYSICGPQLQFVDDIGGGVVLFRGGEMNGDLNVDSQLFDVGSVESLGYVMQFITARIQID